MPTVDIVQRAKTILYGHGIGEKPVLLQCNADAAESVSGDVVIAGGSFDRARIETVNGDIVYRSALRKDGKLHVETINGGVNIDFVGDVSARFDIETFNGDIENCFGPEAQRTSRYAPGRELSFTEGAGESRVVISSFNGDLTICK